MFKRREYANGSRSAFALDKVLLLLKQEIRMKVVYALEQNIPRSLRVKQRPGGFHGI